MRESDYLHLSPETGARLLKIPTLRHFGASFNKILTVSKIRTYEAGEEIIREGGTDKWVYCLMAGRARVVKAGEPIASLGPGAICGEMSIIDGSARSATVEACATTICLASDLSLIDRTGGNNELFLFILYRMFAQILTERLRQTSQQLIAARRELAQLRGGAEELVIDDHLALDIEELFPDLDATLS
ncbi:MAG: cyclic nucleotide-binding domain-containing protein [Thermodesulfobacteriota bacterium]